MARAVLGDAEGLVQSPLAIFEGDESHLGYSPRRPFRIQIAEQIAALEHGP
jgi:hypothetical protein